MMELKKVSDKIKGLLSDDRTRMYFILGVAAILAALYLIFAIIPKSFELSRISRELNELNDKINLVNSRAKRLDEMGERLRSLRTEFEGYSNGLPDQKEIPEFLEELSSIARTSGVRILSITPSELKTVQTGGKDKEYYREMPVTITAKSGYHQLGHFISNLEEGKRFITIEGLQIRYDSNFPRQHNIRMVLKTYVAVGNNEEK